MSRMALYLVLWFGLLLPAALVFAIRRGTARRHALACTMLVVDVMAVAEFAFASLADAAETARHLFIFHIFTDASIVLTLIATAEALHKACPASLRRPAAAAVACGTAIFAAAIVKAEFAPAAEPVARNIPFISGAVDGASRSVAYSGIWRAIVFPQAFGGTLSYSDQPGATARVCFDGTELQFIYTKAPNRGMAQVTLDGMLHSVDLYAPGIVWKAYTVFGGLKPGRHCAVVRVLGRHTVGSSGNFIDVHAFVGH